MDYVLLAARVLFAFMFLGSGLNHLKNSDAMAGYAQFKKVPMPKLSVQVSGLICLFGGLSVILGVWTDIGALALAILLVLMAVKMHDFWNADAAAKQSEQIGFLKNISMAGGALFIFAINAQKNADYALQLVGGLLGK